MKVIIVGCGRVGARVAADLDSHGEDVTVIDHNVRAFNRLPPSFGGQTVRGNGTDEDVLRSAGTEEADLLMSLTEGDNRNALSAQVAKHTFGVPRVIAKINDPLRGEAYRALGLETICRTVILGDALVTATLEGAEATGGFVEPATAEPLRGAPAPGSRADQEAQVAMDAAEDVTADAEVIAGGEGRDGGF
jgi:trk system potassium uptake protein